MALKTLGKNALAETLKNLSKTVWLLDMNLNPIGEGKPIVFNEPVQGSITMVGTKSFTIPALVAPRYVILNSNTSTSSYVEADNVSEPISIGNIPTTTSLGQYTLTGLSATVM